jgi:beta-aspartyl-peptidase (threonine type)
MAIVPAIVVHGGAGTVEKERVPAALAGCRAAAERGLAVLARGGSALDAVQAAVRWLEDDPAYNAGTGSALTRLGTVETDAALMDGATLRFGGVGAVPNLGQAIDLARLVLDDGEHALLVGEAAWELGRAHGLTPAAPEALVTPRARARLAAALKGKSGGTVGACAIDAAGHVAAATSTGGLSGKRPGRVGDTPLPGCGTYADDRGGAASATGTGELILRVTLTRVVVDLLRAGRSAREAAEGGIAELTERVGGDAGVICIDRTGEIGVARSSEMMPHAIATLAAPQATSAL